MLALYGQCNWFEGTVWLGPNIEQYITFLHTTTRNHDPVALP